MCHYTTIYKAAHLSPIGLIGPVRTGPYFLALANILHPSAVGARGCSGHQLLKTQNRSKFLLSNFLKSAFSEVRAEPLRRVGVLPILPAALSQGCFDPSGMVAPCKDWASASCSSVTLASLRLASERLAFFKFAPCKLARSRFVSCK